MRPLAIACLAGVCLAAGAGWMHAASGPNVTEGKVKIKLNRDHRDTMRLDLDLSDSWAAPVQEDYSGWSLCLKLGDQAGCAVLDRNKIRTAIASVKLDPENRMLRMKLKRQDLVDCFETPLVRDTDGEFHAAQLDIVVTLSDPATGKSYTVFHNLVLFMYRSNGSKVKAACGPDVGQ